jgi:hypothetical protein
LTDIDLKTFAAEIDAVVSSAGDPFTRFIAALSDPKLRVFCEDTLRLRDELVQNTQRLLIAETPEETAAYALWLAKNAHEVGYRWQALRRAVTRWSVVRSFEMPRAFPDLDRLASAHAGRWTAKAETAGRVLETEAPRAAHARRGRVRGRRATLHGRAGGWAARAGLPDGRRSHGGPASDQGQARSWDSHGLRVGEGGWRGRGGYDRRSIPGARRMPNLRQASRYRSASLKGAVFHASSHAWYRSAVSEGAQKAKGQAGEERAKPIAREWPEHFPGDCPTCEQHRPVDGPVFRLHREPANRADTTSWLEAGRASGSSDCVRAGLSCCLTRDDAEALRRAMTHMRGRKIARADLAPIHGCIAQTGAPGHHSLWLRHGALGQYFALFKVIE